MTQIKSIKPINTILDQEWLSREFGLPPGENGAAHENVLDAARHQPTVPTPVSKQQLEFYGDAKGPKVGVRVYANLPDETRGVVQVEAGPKPPLSVTVEINNSRFGKFVLAKPHDDAIRGTYTTPEENGWSATVVANAHSKDELTVKHTSRQSEFGQSEFVFRVRSDGEVNAKLDATTNLGKEKNKVLKLNVEGGAGSDSGHTTVAASAGYNSGPWTVEGGAGSDSGHETATASVGFKRNWGPMDVNVNARLSAGNEPSGEVMLRGRLLF